MQCHSPVLQTITEQKRSAVRIDNIMTTNISDFSLRLTGATLPLIM